MRGSGVFGIAGAPDEFLLRSLLFRAARPDAESWEDGEVEEVWWVGRPVTPRDVEVVPPGDTTVC